jgi:toxin ParE1/3/4
MARLLLTEAADADTDDILADLAVKAGLAVAIKYEQLFYALYRRLIDHPASGARRPALGRSVRIGVVSPYLVVYRHAKATDTVTVLRILRGRRRITRRLLLDMH